METVTDERANPFGMRADGPAAFGYGDPNGDFHVVGDNPRVHGGAETGIPFTGRAAGERLQSVLINVGLADATNADEPALRNTYLSYAHPPVTDAQPTDADYRDAERYLDAEVRAVNAHVLVAVGDRALEYALHEHTTHAHRLPADAAALHARELRGRGFLVVPVREPEDWTERDRETLVDRLESILARDYRQTKGIPTPVG